MRFSEKLGKLNKLAKDQKEELKTKEKDSKITISSDKEKGELKVAKDHTENNSEMVDKEENQKDMDNRYDKHVDVLI